MNDVHHVLSLSTVAIIFALSYGAPESVSKQALLWGICGWFIKFHFFKLATVSADWDWSRPHSISNLSTRSYSHFAGLIIRLVLPLPTILLIYSQTNCPKVLMISSSSLYSLSMIWILQIINKLWKVVKECLTHQGSTLGPAGKLIDQMVKFIAFSSPGRVIVLINTVAAYFMLPIGLYVLWNPLFFCLAIRFLWFKWSSSSQYII